ncbi:MULTISPECIES: phage shock protein PspA [Thalassotalea]|uniref:Phage shock protein PspA n=1 Tax=Thalassotalea castellviae TaxID=3075612 RepID=A0ABU3A773_9GAMM|nr:phage shock protein PspA [Thalassotalea sp. W431]MDT0604948.1 phage shock protein PspA [Thalassotalea sp. W431]
MGMFSRFTDIINANLNSMLDKAEDPEKMIKLIIQEMEETLVEVRSTAAKHIAEKKTLSRQIKSIEKNIANWQDKAQTALAKEREDLAKSALVEKHKCQTQLDALMSELTELEEFLASVQNDGQNLQNKLAEAKRRQDAYLLRQQSAQVRLKVREKAAVYNIEDAINKFERYQQKIDEVEAQVEAYDMTSNQDLTSQINALEADEAIDKELAEMKKQVVNG